MCQLAAYVGDRPLAETLLDSLRAQEGYIGAHATGLATLKDNRIELVSDQDGWKKDDLGIRVGDKERVRWH